MKSLFLVGAVLQVSVIDSDSVIRLFIAITDV